MTYDKQRLGGRAGGLTTVARYGADAIAARARTGLWRRFEHEVDPDGMLDPVERRARALRARKAHMIRLAIKSANARAARKGWKTPTATRRAPTT